MHGIADWQPPETQVAWRKEVKEITGNLLDEYKPTDLIEAYPLKPHELLKEPSHRAFKQFEAMAKRLAGTPTPVLLVHDDGKVEVTTLNELADKDNKDRIERITVLLPPSAGGLEGGMLNGSTASPEVGSLDVADEWFITNREGTLVRQRRRLWDADTNDVEVEEMHSILSITFPGADEDAAEKFWEWFSVANEGDNSFIQINSSGQMIASNSTFSIDQVVYQSGSVLGNTDLKASAFNTSVYLPINYVTHLTNNDSFNGVFLTNSIATGTVNPNPLGTVTSTTQYYAVAGNIAIASGATLNVNAGSYFIILDNTSVTVNANAAMNVTNPSGFTLQEGANNLSQGVAVNGTLTLSNFSVLRDNNFNNSDLSIIQINSDGKMVASNSTFSIDQVSYQTGSVLANIDLTNNAFNSALYVPANYVANLTNNKSFSAVYLIGSTVTGTLNLNPLGTVDPSTQYYLTAGSITVASGATLNVNAGSYFIILDSTSVTVNVNATMNVTSPSGFTVQEGANNLTQGVAVNGTLTLANVSVVRDAGFKIVPRTGS